MQKRTLLNTRAFELTVNRLCFQLIENYQDFENAIIIGMQPRGVNLAQRIISRLKQIKPEFDIPSGSLDITFYRDDFRRGEQPLKASKTEMNHLIENKKVILIDDVLFTGRSIRAAMDALLDYGRPSQVELLVLIDRRFSRDLPIQPNYIGRKVDSISSERVEVRWKEIDGKDSVILLMKKNGNE